MNNPHELDVSVFDGMTNTQVLLAILKNHGIDLPADKHAVDLKTLGVDSLSRVEIIIDVEEAFNVEIEDKDWACRDTDMVWNTPRSFHRLCYLVGLSHDMGAPYKHWKMVVG